MDCKKLQAKNHDVPIVDPAELDLPLLDKMYKEMNDLSEKLQSLQTILAEADGYVPVTLEYNHSISTALKNTLDYFLEEYFFKSPAIVSYSVGVFGGVVAANHFRQTLAEMWPAAIPSQFPISKIHEALDESGNLVDTNYDRHVARFLDEFDWYIEALQKQRKIGTPY